MHRKQSHCAPHLHIYHLKRRHFIASYVQPVMQQYESLKRTFAIKVATMKITDNSITNGSHHVPTTKSALFVESKDEWNTKDDTGKSMKNALHAQWYGKRHLSSWSNIKQWKNQAHSLSHCWAMRVWRHQAGRQDGRQAVTPVVSQQKIMLNKFFLIS